MVRMKVTKPLGEWPASASKPAPRSLTVCMFLDVNTYLVRYAVALYTLLRKPNRYCHMVLPGKFTSIYFSKGYSIPRLLSWMHDSNDPCA